MQTTLKLNQKLISIVLITATLLFASCKKDKHPDPAPPPPPANPALQEYKDGEDFMRFEYNTDGSLKKATVKNDINTSGDIVDFSISYAAGKISEVNSSSGEKIVPVYENNVLKRAEYFVAGQRTGYTNYYFENGNIKRVTIYAGEGTEYNPLLEFMYTYNGDGNVTEGVIMVATNRPGYMVRAGHAEMQYDQKINPLYTHKDFLLLLWQGPSKNNVIVENIFDAQLTLEDKYQYEYTYKTSGLPEKAQVKIGLPGNPVTMGSVGFTYK
ncbi:hypothetical protein [Agriterribacter sp.]|uniref:hypothetical protein n=1 Tax=Agriterribacter sp. TaxID=2821509 RepID=UPI002C80CE21|nr:hypothetical protein [Agriterribacter sp.]HRO48367.1 hypothetical protein [Agriterribacter sp.]HRQ19374.1 hypothetical protein [Agriterribacter sp.]